MKRLLALTLFALLAISCSRGNSGISLSSKGANMTYSVGTQADLDAANQRVNEYRQELVRQGFREVSKSTLNSAGAISNSREEVVLEGQYGKLKDLQVTLWTTKLLQKDQTQLGGGIHASIIDDQADQDFETLYKKVVFVVTGNAQ
jgi:hypothetical protein